MTKILFKELSFEYEFNGSKYKALDRINLEIEEREFVCIIGHSGCGKTTLLNIAAGLLKPSDGNVFVNGKEVNGPGLDRSVVFQHYSLFPWMTVKRNVMFGIKQSHSQLSKRTIESRAIHALEQVELDDVLDKYPFQISIGMQQRVAIARVLAMESNIMILDEPFAALDPKIKYSLQETLENLWSNESKRKTVLFVTHDIEEAIFLLTELYLCVQEKYIVK
jgi:NitT/TauT family transport system ATP-binding protein